MKKCYACGLEKPQEEFRKAKSETGYSAKCSQCWCDEAAAAAVRRRQERHRQLIAAGGKVCCRCRERRALEQFQPRTASADGLNSFCLECDRIRWRERRKDPDIRLEQCSKAKRHYWKDPEKARARARGYTAKRPEQTRDSQRRAREKGRVMRWAEMLVLSFTHRSKVARHGLPDVDAAYLLQLFAEQGGRCYWLGIPMVPSPKNRDPRRPSVDRLDNTKGYVRGNVVLACQFANMGRSTLDAESFGDFIIELKSQMRNG